MPSGGNGGHFQNLNISAAVYSTPPKERCKLLFTDSRYLVYLSAYRSW